MLNLRKRSKAQTTIVPGLFASLGQFTLDLIFPPRCVHCGRVDTHWCPTCYDDLLANPIDRQHTTIDAQLTVSSSGDHSGILQHGVQGLKYHGIHDLAAPLAARLIDDIPADADGILPVPMHTERLRQRGYNQAALLAEALAEHTGLPLHMDYLHRVRATRTQVGLSRAERRNNVEDAFQASADVAGKILVLVDDVYTTGATLLGCTQALLQADAKAVYGTTVTRALLHNADAK